MTPVSPTVAEGRSTPVPGDSIGPRHPRSCGFTVAELVVSLALTSAIVLICSQLLVEAFDLARTAAHRLPPSSLVAITASLRKDLHQAASVAAPAIGWQQGPLELVGWDGGVVRYELDGGQLIRESRLAPGSPPVRRVLNRSVLSWWWRPVNEQTVQLRVTVGVTGSPSDGDGHRRVLERTFAARGGADGRSW